MLSPVRNSSTPPHQPNGGDRRLFFFVGHLNHPFFNFPHRKLGMIVTSIPRSRGRRRSALGGLVTRWTCRCLRRVPSHRSACSHLHWEAIPESIRLYTCLDTFAHILTTSIHMSIPVFHPSPYTCPYPCLYTYPYACLGTRVCARPCAGIPEPAPLDAFTLDGPAADFERRSFFDALSWKHAPLLIWRGGLATEVEPWGIPMSTPPRRDKHSDNHRASRVLAVGMAEAVKRNQHSRR